jgi:hypothetical protein
MKVLVVGDFKNKQYLINKLIEQSVEVIQDNEKTLRGKVADQLFIDESWIEDKLNEHQIPKH